MPNQFKNLIFKNDALYDGFVSSSRMICHIKNGIFYKGSVTVWSHAVALVKDGKIYDGDRVASRYLKGFQKDNIVYAGSAPLTRAIVLMQKGLTLYLGSVQRSSAEFARIKGTEQMDLATYAALIHYFISPILNL